MSESPPSGSGNAEQKRVELIELAALGDGCTLWPEGSSGDASVADPLEADTPPEPLDVIAVFPDAAIAMSDGNLVYTPQKPAFASWAWADAIQGNPGLVNKEGLFHQAVISSGLLSKDNIALHQGTQEQAARLKMIRRALVVAAAGATALVGTLVAVHFTPESPYQHIERAFELALGYWTSITAIVCGGLFGGTDFIMWRDVHKVQKQHEKNRPSHPDREN